MKERLVGAAVLVAIAVWLIPWVLDGPEDGVEASPSSLQLPAAEEPMPMRTQTLRLGDPEEASAEPARSAGSPPPEVATASARPAGQADAPEERAPAETTVAAVRPEPEPSVSAPPARSIAPPPKASAPAPASTAAAGDWTVQLGSFSDEANARRMAQRAGTYGYKADVSSYRSGARTLYRVRVGPQATRGAAEAAASALRAHGIKEASVVAAR